VAHWEFRVQLTDEADAEYQRLKRVAENQVSLRPVPYNRDPHSQGKLALIEHYERTRRILTGLKRPATSVMDVSLVGRFSFMRYWNDIGTCVYFVRRSEDAVVTVIHICDAPLDHDALYKLVLSGKAHVLEQIGIIVPTGELEHPLNLHL
jgi:hypothetical protein